MWRYGGLKIYVIFNYYVFRSQNKAVLNYVLLFIFSTFWSTSVFFCLLFSESILSYVIFPPPILTGDGKCVICDSYVRPCTLVRICDECNYGSYQGRCVICGGPGVSDAYYCKECTIQEKDVSVLKHATYYDLTGLKEISCICTVNISLASLRWKCLLNRLLFVSFTARWLS